MSAKKRVNTNLIMDVGTDAVHTRTTSQKVKKTIENKKKNITYPENYETLFNEQVKNVMYDGTFQAFIRSAIREKLIASGVDIEQLK